MLNNNKNYFLHIYFLKEMSIFSKLKFILLLFIEFDFLEW